MDEVDTIRSETLRARAARRERVRFPLALKLFLLITVLIALVVLLAIGVSIRRSNEVATEAVNRSIRDAGDLFQEFQKNRLKELQLGATIVGNDVSFVSYIQDALYHQIAEEESASQSAPGAGSAEPSDAGAPPAVDTASILDQLQQRRELLGTDLLILTDDQGYMVARTDQTSLSAQAPGPVDLYEGLPLLKTVIDGEAPYAAGVISLDGRLYHAAVAPLSVGAGRVVAGYLINAFVIDDHFANRIGQTTRAGVLFLPVETGPRSTPVRSADAPNADEVRRMASMGPLFAGERIGAQTVTIDRSSYVLTAEPLEARGGGTVGAVVFIRSLDEELAPYREIQRALTWAGGLTLLVGFLVSYLIAKRITRPIEELAGMAQAVTEGDYSVRPDIDRSDEVGILSRSFGKMVSALRDKAELEVLYQEMAARSDQKPKAAVKPSVSEGTVLITELRGLPRGGDSEGAGRVIGLVSDVMKIQRAEIVRQDGRVIDVSGHRMISLFTGDRGIVHAVRAARAVNEEIALQMAGRPELSIGAGIATGEVITGTVAAGDSVDIAVVGHATQLALLLAWAAPIAHAYIPQESAQAVGAEVLAASTSEQIRVAWLTDPLAVVGLPLKSITTSMMRSPGVTAGGTLRLDETMPSAPTSELSIDSTFAGRYVVEALLGRGGMGVVYRARDTQLDESVAIKVLPDEVMKRSPEELDRFKREIRLARRITHRNVLRTYDYGEADGVYFISMEYIRGYTLAELLAQTPQLAPRIAMGISRQICRGLQAAHEEGVIHRDIKPQNVLIDHRGEVKLMDFGIARMTESDEAMTAAGIVVGTPHYMSPEQVQGKTLDSRSDVYSMGIMMYQMLCGKLPFDSSSLTAVLTAHITDKPEEPIRIRKEIGREINAIILRCLDKEPGRRFDDSGALLAELDRLQVAGAA